MKKTLLISSAVLVALGLTAFGVVDYKSSNSCNVANAQAETIEAEAPLNDFYYGVGPRFEAIQKDDVHNATKIVDFLDEKYHERIVSVKNVSVIIIANEAQSHIRADGTKAKFTAKQLKLLRSFGYSSNFTVQMDIIQKNPETGEIEDGHLGPHLTIVPEKQAFYNDGEEALIEFVKTKTEEDLPTLDTDNMMPTKYFFTISKKGKLAIIEQDRTSGYPAVDAKIRNLLKNLPGDWTPAENAKGEKVDQELVLTFGANGVGC